MNEVGWKCSECGWSTFSLEDMHRFVNKKVDTNKLTMVCPRCHAEGAFVDAHRGET